MPVPVIQRALCAVIVPGCQDGGMDAFDHVRLPDGRRLDMRVSGPAGGFRWCFITGRPVLPPRCGRLSEQRTRVGFAW
jgi:hypothetical protein